MFPWEKFDVLKRKCAALASDRRELFFALENVLADKPRARAEARRILAGPSFEKRPQRPLW